MKAEILAVTALLSSSILGVPALSAQDAKTGTTLSQAEQVRVQELCEKLGAPDFAVRREAAKELEGLGEKARAALEACAKDGEDPELRWQARRLLRRLDGGHPKLERAEGGSAGQATGPEDGTGGLPGRWRWNRDGQISVQGQGTKVQITPQGVVVELETEVDGKQDVKKYEAPDLDTLLKQHPELKAKIGTFRMPGLGQGFRVEPRGFGFRFGPGAPGGEEFRKEMERFQQEMDRFHDQMRRWSEDFGKGPIQVVPPLIPFDGAQPRAGTLEQEIARLEQRIQALRDQLDATRAEEQVKREQAGGEAHAKADTKAEQNTEENEGALRPVPEGPKLGIYVGEGDTEAVARFLGLPEGVGLWVQGIVDGSLAAKLGLEAGDLLVKLGDRWIHSPADVAAALGALDKGQELSAEWYRKGAAKKARTRL